MKKTIMIFGISSFIGSNLLEQLKDEFRVIGTYYQTPVVTPGVTSLPCDVLRKEFVSSLVALFRPDVIIYAAGLNSLLSCEKNTKRCESLNATGAINCSTASDRFGSKFIYFSSGFVFDGSDISVRESETPFPETTYGKTLSSTEFYIQRSCLNYVILRLSSLYGRGYVGFKNNWFEKLQKSFEMGESFYIDDTIHTGFLDTNYVVEAIKSIIKKDITNRLLNVSSKNFSTRLDFAKTYAKIFKKDQSLIQPQAGFFPGQQINESEVNPHLHFKLDTTTFEEILDLKLPTIEESLLLSHKRWSSLAR